MRGIARPRGTMLRLIDRDKLSELVCSQTNAWLEERGYKERTLEAWPIESLAVSDTPAGLFIIGSEGVGYEVTDEKPFTTLQVGSRWTDEKGVSHRTMTGGTYEGVSLTPEQLRAVAVGEEIDLADLVREFGDRLETNFDIWYYRINGSS